MKRGMRKKISKATIFSARIFQLVARITMIVLSTIGSIAGGAYAVVIANINEEFRFLLFFVVEVMILLFLTSFSYFNEVAGSIFWIIYCVIAFGYLHFRVPRQIYGLWLNYIILIGGIGVGLLLFFAWYIEWNDPLYRILRKMEEKSFEDR